MRGKAGHFWQRFISITPPPPPPPCYCRSNCTISMPEPEGNEISHWTFYSQAFLNTPQSFSLQSAYQDYLSGCTYVWVYSHRQTLGIDDLFVDGCQANVGVNLPGKGFTGLWGIGRVKFQYRLMLCQDNVFFDITGDAVSACGYSDSTPLNGPPYTDVVLSDCLSGEYMWWQTSQESGFASVSDEFLYKRSWCDGSVVLAPERPPSPEGTLDVVPTLNCGNP